MNTVIRTVLLLVLIASASLTSWAATHTTANFVVTAASPEFARQVGEAAEVYRAELSQFWLGYEMPNWFRKCPVQVNVGRMGAGGATTFQFDRGEVGEWQMTIEGSEERILDSVLPHEINHTIFACYFRRPLPRWADEGAASIIEHGSERLRLRKIHEEAMQASRKIPLRNLLAMKEYPEDRQTVLTLYAEGHALADFLLQDGNRKKYLQFLELAHKQGWDKALQKCYGYNRVEELEADWEKWIVAGYPSLKTAPASLASNAETVTAPGQVASETPIVRGQNPDPATSSSRGFTQPEKPMVPTATGKLSRTNLQMPLVFQRNVSAEWPQQEASARLPRP